MVVQACRPDQRHFTLWSGASAETVLFGEDQSSPAEHRHPSTANPFPASLEKVSPASARYRGTKTSPPLNPLPKESGVRQRPPRPGSGWLLCLTVAGISVPQSDQPWVAGVGRSPDRGTRRLTLVRGHGWAGVSPCRPASPGKPSRPPARCQLGLPPTQPSNRPAELSPQTACPSGPREPRPRR